MAEKAPMTTSPPNPPPDESIASPGKTVDPRTGEPKRGILGLYQKIEDLLGQGAVACLLIVIAFLIYAAYKINSL